MPSRRLRLTTIAALLAGACSGSTHDSDNPPGNLAIAPNAGYSRDPVATVITGTGFLVKPTQPQGGGAPTIDTRHRAWIETKDGKKELGDVTWLGTTTLGATVPGGVEPGTYDLTVENALGNRGTRKAAYTVLDTPPFFVTASVDHPSVNVGQTLTLTVTVENRGSGEVTDFKLGTPVLGSTDGGSCNPGAVPGDVPSKLGAGEQRTFSWTYTPSHAGNISIAVSATGADSVTGEAVTAALAAPVAVAITASPVALFVTAIVDLPDVNVGQILTLTVTVENGGSGEITDLALGMPVLRSNDGAAASPGTAPGDVPSKLGTGEQRSFSWTYTASHVGHISITASAMGVDAVSGNAVVAALAAPVAVVVHQLPAALTSKLSASSPTPNVGEGVTMTLELANAVGAAAADVTAVTPSSSASMVCPTTALASAPVRIAGGATGTFTWTCTATAQSNYTLSAAVAATDVNTGTSMTTSVTAVTGMVMRVAYRWWSASVGDHFYTLDAGSEPASLGYVEEGRRFRMYPADAPGTTPFLRFWSSTASDHFYTASADEGERAKSLGYSSENDIGNIGTSALPGSIALQRYWNGTIGDHFYTTDTGLAPDSGYQWEGIAGYVLPCP
jgi:hypothetical protein